MLLAHVIAAVSLTTSLVFFTKHSLEQESDSALLELASRRTRCARRNGSDSPGIIDSTTEYVWAVGSGIRDSNPTAQ